MEAWSLGFGIAVGLAGGLTVYYAADDREVSIGDDMGVIAVFLFSFGVAFVFLVLGLHDYLTQDAYSRRASYSSSPSSSSSPAIRWPWFLRQLLFTVTLLLPTVAIFILLSSSSSSSELPVKKILFESFVVAQRSAITAPMVLALLDSTSAVFNPSSLLVVCLPWTLFPIPRIFASELALASTHRVGCFVATLVLFGIGAVQLCRLAANYFRELWGKSPHGVGFARSEYGLAAYLVLLLGFTVETAVCIVLEGADLDEEERGRVERIGAAVTNCFFVALLTTSVVVSSRARWVTALDSACRALDDKNSFVRHVNHEIRTPLNAASVGISLLSDKETVSWNGNNNADDDEDDTSELLRNTKEAMEVAIEMLNDYLTYDKISSNLMKLERVDVRPLEFLQRSLSMFTLQATQKGVHFELPTSFLTVGFNEEADPELALHNGELVLSVDPHKMKQVLRNFVSNALKFTPPGGSVVVAAKLVQRSPDSSGRPVGSPRLDEAKLSFRKLVASSDDWDQQQKQIPWLRVEVKDDGAGISAENLPKVFNEIVQFHANTLQDGKGTGVGLYISKGITELHGGKVFVHSDGEGKGTVFSVELPLKVPEVVVNATMESGRSDPSLRQKPMHFMRVYSKVTPGFSNCSMSPEKCWSFGEVEDWPFDEDFCALVVDDSKINVKMVSRLLTSMGFQCDAANNGQEAVEKVRTSLEAANRPYDIVILDHHMPVMTGLEACSKMRFLGFNNPIFGLSGDTEDEGVGRFQAAGANGVFLKPLQNETFKVAIKRSLQRARAPPL